jgi:two-component sensor histidine kinase
MLRNELVSMGDTTIDFVEERNVVIDNKGRFVHISKEIQVLFDLENSEISGISDLSGINPNEVLRFFNNVPLNEIKQKTIFIQVNLEYWKLKVRFYVQQIGQQKTTFISVKEHELVANTPVFFERKIKSLERKLNLQEQIMNEMNHRIKNNISIAASYLRLKRDSCQDDYHKNILTNSIQQLLTIADFHAFVSLQAFNDGIEMYGYLSKIIHHVTNCFIFSKEKIKFELHCDALKLFNDKAIIIGLILNELISNTIKHTLPTIEVAHASISLTFTNEQFLLIYTDNGTEKLDFEAIAGNGLSLVQGLCNQLNGKYKIAYKNGFYFQLKFA